MQMRLRQVLSFFPWSIFRFLLSLILSISSIYLNFTWSIFIVLDILLLESSIKLTCFYVLATRHKDQSDGRNVFPHARHNCAVTFPYKTNVDTWLLNVKLSLGNVTNNTSRKYFFRIEIQTQTLQTLQVSENIHAFSMISWINRQLERINETDLIVPLFLRFQTLISSRRLTQIRKRKRFPHGISFCRLFLSNRIPRTPR